MTRPRKADSADVREGAGPVDHNVPTSSGPADESAFSLAANFRKWRIRDFGDVSVSARCCFRSVWNGGKRPTS